MPPASTIFPLSPVDRKAVLDTAKNWLLEDLSVVVFTYAPIPHTFEARAGKAGGAVYLVDNSGLAQTPTPMAAAQHPQQQPAPPQQQGDAPQQPNSGATAAATADEDYFWKLTENQVREGVRDVAACPACDARPNRPLTLPSPPLSFTRATTGLPWHARVDVRPAQDDSAFHQEVQPLRGQVRGWVAEERTKRWGEATRSCEY